MALQFAAHKRHMHRLLVPSGTVIGDSEHLNIVPLGIIDLRICQNLHLLIEIYPILILVIIYIYI